MVQWDRQDEFTGSTPVAPTVRGNDTQPTAQPQPQARPIAERTPDAAASIHADYADLQVAVRNRYNNPTPVKQSTKQTANSPQATSPDTTTFSEALPTGNLVITTPKATAIAPETNAFQSGSLRGNKLNYAHAPFNYSSRKTNASATSFRSSQLI